MIGPKTSGLMTQKNMLKIYVDYVNIPQNILSNIRSTKLPEGTIFWH